MTKQKQIKNNSPKQERSLGGARWGSALISSDTTQQIKEEHECNFYSGGPMCLLCIKEGRKQAFEAVEKVINNCFFYYRKRGRGVGDIWEDLKSKIKQEIK